MAQTYDRFEGGKRRWRNSILTVVTGLLGLAIVVWLARPYYRLYQEQHSEAQAQRFLAQGDYRNAWLSARQTIALNPTNLAACRVMVQLAEVSHSPAVLDWQRRIALTQPTIENKLALAAAGLRYQSPPFAMTAQILDELAVAATNLASYQAAAASLALSTRRLAAAETHFEIAARLQPTNQLYEMNLAILRLGLTNEAKTAAARAVLEKLRMDAVLGTPALRALVVDRLAHQATVAAQVFSIQLLATKQATLADQLQHLGILQQLKSDEFAPGWQAVLRQTNAPAVAEVSAWMQANGLLTENLKWLTNLPAGLRSQSPIRLALANGYLQAEDWRALRDYAAKGDWAEMEFLRLALLSRAWSQLGAKPVADRNWAAAVTKADNRYAAMTMLLDLAERWQWQRHQEDLLSRIVQKFPPEPWAYRALERLYLAAGNTRSLQQLYTRLFAIFPEDVGFKNNLAATCLLLQTNLPQAFKLAEEVYAGRTNDLIVVSTYAFALHLQGRTKDGLAAMKTLNPQRLQQPEAALYYGILLAATGATNEAAPFLKIARTKTEWLPEEKLLLSTALGEL